MAGPQDPNDASPYDPLDQAPATPPGWAPDVEASRPFLPTPSDESTYELWQSSDPLADFEATWPDQPPPPAPSLPVAPVRGGERVDLIDSMRGFAVFGILLMNMSWFAWPPARHFGSYVVQYTSRIDEVADLLFRFFCEGKFYIIFSFLFGLGMAVQKERTEARGRSFFFFFARRMFWLGAIGVIHAYFIWSGDILVTYAMSGAVLLCITTAWSLLRNAMFGTHLTDPRGWSVAPLLGACCLLALLFLSALNWFALSAEKSPDWNEALLEDVQSAHRYRADMAVYKHGSYSDTLDLRIAEAHVAWESFSFLGLLVMASFLFGAFTWRAGLIQEAQRHHRAIRAIFVVLLPIGLVANAVYIAADRLHMPQSQNALGFFSHFFGQYTLGYAYLAGLILLHLSGRATGMFRALAPVGRMALTNYLTHSVVFTLIFNGYGLGLMGEIGEVSAYLLAIALYGLQVVGSDWWLKRYRFGPMEWLWRSLTYRKTQPMLRTAHVAPSMEEP